MHVMDMNKQIYVTSLHKAALTQICQRLAFGHPIGHTNFIILFVLVTSTIAILSLQWTQASASVLDELSRPFANKQQNTIGFKLYENGLQKIRIQYPAAWTINSTFDSTDPASVVNIYGPRGEVVDISINTLSDPTDLKTDANDSINYYQNSSKDFKLLELNTDINLAGQPAYKLVFTSIDPETNTIFKSMVVTAIVGNKAYDISYSADPDIYQSSLPLVEKIIDSFEITGTSGIAGTSSLVR
jgi:hypothetical protein